MKRNKNIKYIILSLFFLLLPQSLFAFTEVTKSTDGTCLAVDTDGSHLYINNVDITSLSSPDFTLYYEGILNTGTSDCVVSLPDPLPNGKTQGSVIYPPANFSISDGDVITFFDTTDNSFISSRFQYINGIFVYELPKSPITFINSTIGSVITSTDEVISTNIANIIFIGLGLSLLFFIIYLIKKIINK